MRIVIDSLVALMLCGFLAGVVLQTRAERRLEDKIELAQAEVGRLQSQILLQAAVERVEMSTRGYPSTVEVEWFGGDTPVNPLLGPAHPWVEIAGESQRDLRHPTKRMAFDTDTAQFWYNPYTGVVRARVPSDVSDATAVRIYNRINGCDLADLYARNE